MKSRIACSLGCIVVATGLTFWPAVSGAGEPGFQSLFDGRSLGGWTGNPELWSVKEGVITGVTSKEKPLKHNTFLVYTNREFSDFELRLSYRIVGGNSGIQYRSKVQSQGAFGPIVGGYQADFEAGKTYSGINYEERGRGILAQRGQKTVIKPDPADPNKHKVEVIGDTGKTSAELQAAIRNEDWNEYVIIAKGNRLVHQINGNVTCEVTDEQPAKAAKSGIIALQIHVGPPMTVQFKEIRIRPLSGGDAAALDLDRIQGNWGVAELVRRGEKASASDLAGLKLQVKGASFSLSGVEGGQEGTIRLDASSNPKTLDATTQSGDEAIGIYEITGETLRVCYAIDGAARPRQFASVENSDVTLITFKREQE